MDFHLGDRHQQTAEIVSEEHVLSSFERQRVIAAYPDWERDGYAEFDGMHDTIDKVYGIIEEEIEIYEHDFKAIVGPQIASLLNALFALTQQFVACNPRLWKAIVSLRKDRQYRLIWYPTAIFTSAKQTASFLISGTLLDKEAKGIKTGEEACEADYCNHDDYCEILYKTDGITTKRETGHAEFLHASSPWMLHREACGHVMHLVLLAITDRAQGTLEGTNVGPTYAELRKSLAFFSMPKDLAGETLDYEFYPSPLSRHLANVGPLGDAVMGRLSWDAAPVQRIVHQAFADDQTEWNKYVADIESRLENSFEIGLDYLRALDRDHYGKNAAP